MQSEQQAYAGKDPMWKEGACQAPPPEALQRIDLHFAYKMCKSLDLLTSEELRLGQRRHQTLSIPYNPLTCATNRELATWSRTLTRQRHESLRTELRPCDRNIQHHALHLRWHCMTCSRLYFRGTTSTMWLVLVAMPGLGAEDLQPPHHI